MDVAGILALATLAFAAGLAARQPADVGAIERVVRRHIATQIKQYALATEKVNLSVVLRIIEAKACLKG